LIDLLARHPRVAAGCALIAALAALPFAARLQVDNSIEVWLDRDAAAYQTYQEFLTQFGSEEFLLLIYALPSPLDDEFLFELTDLRLDLEEIDGVRLAIDPSSLRTKFFGGAGAGGFESELRGSPFYRDFLLSADGQLTATWLALDFDQPADRAVIVERVEAVVEGRWPGREVWLAGPPVVNATLDRYSRRAARTLFPFVFAISAAVLLFRFRSLQALVVPFVSVGSGIAVTLGLLQVTGRSLDMVTAALPSVLWVLGLSSSIHLLSSYRRHAAVEGAMREVARPCLFSAVTTALGFLALLVSEMQPVREMGLFAAVGVVLCLAANFALFPLLARLGRAPGAGESGDESRAARRWPMAIAGLAFRRPVAVLVAAAVLTGLLVGGIFRLGAESNVVEFFKEDAPISRTYRQILPRITGSFSLEVLLTPPGEPVTAEVFEELDRLQGLLGAVDGVAKAFSPVDLVKKMNQVSTGAPPESWKLPADEDRFSLAWDMASSSLEEELALFFDPAGGTLRMSLLAQPMASEAHQRLVREVREILEREADPAWGARATGIVDLLVEMQTALVRSQVKSFALAFLLIAPVIALLLRSRRYALLSVAPNLLPILGALGTMGALGIRLDPATVMIAAMALGIAVDDTIHFLARYQVERRASARPEALRRTVDAVAQPIADTTIVAASGFLVLALSEFVPLVYFGLLTALTLVTALLADLLVLPALLVVSGRRRGEKIAE
jgi:predicted RND superfamily exporter protein